ncbi:MAG: peptide ABC transporter ATP-binding protein [Thermoprotei archaeon]|nr:MAG: peptide ABC transporter ATP-binding protein [Thermoprotei archaeon]
MNEKVIVRVQNLSTYFKVKSSYYSVRKATVKAVQDVSLSILQGETLGLVGESGSGKTTLGRSIIQLDTPSSGNVMFRDLDLTKLKRSQLRNLRRKMQIVYQDPYSSLEARMKVGDIVGEGLAIHKIGTKKERIDRVVELMEAVGLAPDYIYRYPHEFSGGQRQRISVARALALDPEFLVADEPVSALDISVQAQIIKMLIRLSEEYGLTMLFISHDLSVVQYIADRVAVMYLGRIMELADNETLFNNPKHPYTLALLEAVPKPDPRQRRPFVVLPGDIPSPLDPPSGCVFRTRCSRATDECAHTVPELRELEPGHQVACIRV